MITLLFISILFELIYKTIPSAGPPITVQEQEDIMQYYIPVEVRHLKYDNVSN